MAVRLRVVLPSSLFAAALVAPVHSIVAQVTGSACDTPADTARARSVPTIAFDAEPDGRYFVGDSLRIGLSVNHAPAGLRVTFAALDADRAVIDGGNILRWRAARGSEGPVAITLVARAGGTTIACREIRFAVERTQRPPLLRLPARQVQAGTVLEFPVAADDPDGDALTYSVTELTAGSGSASIDSTGRFRWRAPMVSSAAGREFQFRVEVTDRTHIVASVFPVLVNGQNVRPECPLTISTVTATEGSSVLLPLAASDANGDALRFRPERELANGVVDGDGYRWDVPWNTVENGASERTVELQWRAIDPQNAQSDVCTTRVLVRARMEPEALRLEQEAHARFLRAIAATEQDLDRRLDEVREQVTSHERGRRRNTIIALATALAAGSFQLAGSADTRRWAAGVNTLTSAFFSGLAALAPGTDALKADVRKLEDEVARFTPLVTAFRVTYGENVSEVALRNPQYRRDRAALEAEQRLATGLLR